MRTVTYGAACSLDGFIAGVNGEIDWLHMSKDVMQIMGDFWTTIDAVLFGRKTWEVALAQGGGSGGGGAEAGGVRIYVFSRTLTPAGAPGAQLVPDDAGAFVQRLKRERGRGICVMGGGELARSLFEAGVIDEVGLNIHPVLLGRGIPMFPDAGRRVDLKLKESRSIDGGCVLVTYTIPRRRVRPATIQR